MKAEFCEFEDAVTIALSRGQCTKELRTHIETCSHCTDLQLVAEYLSAIALVVEEEMPLPTPGFLWWRAQLAERHEQANRAVAAIEIMHTLAVAVAMIALITFTFLWKPADPSVLPIGGGLLVCTTIVLYGWIRGRI